MSASINFINKKVAILGLSTEGNDSARFFTAEGAQVFCCDQRTKKELGSLYDQLTPLKPKFVLGKNYLTNLTDYDLLVRTAGMSLRLPELIIAQKAGVPITSSTKLFMELVACPVIGVTGTKGKGTTSTLIAKILTANGFSTYLGGNVGTPLLSKVRSISPDAYVVLEFSSFQLEDVTVSPHMAVVLSISSEHLANFDVYATNYHESRDAYVTAKKNLVRFQKQEDYCILDFDDDTSRFFANETAAKKYFFSTKTKVPGVSIKNRAFIWSENQKEITICYLSDISLIGKHQLKNVAAAITTTYLVGVAPEIIQKVIKTYTGLPHRLEFVAKKNGVSFYNDSAATVPEATIAAIGAFSQPIILIVGGSDKGADFTQLGKEIVGNNVKILLVIGQMAEKIEQSTQRALETVKNRDLKIIKGFKSMDKIVEAAYKNAEAGDVILLSPACASFGMFKNYKERGQLFKEYVKKINAT